MNQLWEGLNLSGDRIVDLVLNGQSLIARSTSPGTTNDIGQSLSIERRCLRVG